MSRSSFAVDDFAFDIRRSVAPASHLWVGSGFATVAPQHRTVAGVRGLHSPPFAAPDLALALTLSVDGSLVLDTGHLGKGDVGLLLSGVEWFPDRIERRGTYHHMREGTLVSLATQSTLTPLSAAHGFALEFTITNRGERTLTVGASVEVAGGRAGSVDLSTWDYGWGRVEDAEDIGTLEGTCSENSQARVSLVTDPAPSAQLAPGATATWRWAVDVTEPGTASALSAGHIASEISRTQSTWAARIAASTSALPVLHSEIPGLEAYYTRAVASGLVCLWDNPAFAIQPFPAVSGIEGAGICCYPWDIGGYAARTSALLLGETAVVELLRLMVASGIDQHSRFAPDGTGNDVPYAYSVWSFANLVWAAAEVYGPREEFLSAIQTMLDAESGRVKRWNGLLDYGPQHELLEMRGAGYEHVVASPNAERAWVLERAAEMADNLGVAGSYPTTAWREEAVEIRAAIREHLWDPTRDWFRAVYPADNHEEVIYSVQYFDALRFDACTPEMEAALVSHLREGAFLSPYGVSSVSAEDDLHYELNDPDWSGSGAYTGDGPLLALTLWERGHNELAWNVLQRLLWMGELLPYFPQEHYVDRPVVPEHKRANVIAGLSGAEAIIFGIFGIELGIGGGIRVSPRAVPGRVQLEGLVLRGRTIDVDLTAGHMVLSVDGAIAHDGAPQTVII